MPLHFDINHFSEKVSFVSSKLYDFLFIFQMWIKLLYDYQLDGKIESFKQKEEIHTFSLFQLDIVKFSRLVGNIDIFLGEND